MLHMFVMGFAKTPKNWEHKTYYICLPRGCPTPQSALEKPHWKSHRNNCRATLGRCQAGRDQRTLHLQPPETRPQQPQGVESGGDYLPTWGNPKDPGPGQSRARRIQSPVRAKWQAAQPQRLQRSATSRWFWNNRASCQVRPVPTPLFLHYPCHLQTLCANTTYKESSSPNGLQAFTAKINTCISARNSHFIYGNEIN